MLNSLVVDRFETSAKNNEGIEEGITALVDYISTGKQIVKASNEPQNVDKSGTPGICEKPIERPKEKTPSVPSVETARASSQPSVPELKLRSLPPKPRTRPQGVKPLSKEKISQIKLPPSPSEAANTPPKSFGSSTDSPRRSFDSWYCGASRDSAPTKGAEVSSNTSLRDTSEDSIDSNTSDVEFFSVSGEQIKSTTKL